MEAYLAILIAILPPVALALFPARTARWRTGRRLFWTAFPLAFLVVAVNVAFVDPAGPAPLFFGAWFVFVVVLAVWCYGIAIIRTKWSAWRRIQRERVARGTDPTKPWLK